MPSPATESTMYCLPLCMYVIGAVFVGAGISTRAISAPLALSTACSSGAIVFGHERHDEPYSENRYQCEYENSASFHF